MKVLIIGLGSIGQRHLKNLAELKEVEFIWCPSEIKNEQKEIINRYNVRITESLKEAVLKCPDFAVISNPTSLHVDVAIILAKNTIPFLIEKPVSNTLDGLDTLHHIVAKKTLPVLVGYQFRYHPAFIKIDKFIQEGVIGNPMFLYAQLGQWLPDWHPNEDYRHGGSAKVELGGGVILDLSHEIDLAVKLFGPAKKVSAICGKFSQLEIETEDIGEITILHENNRISHIHLDYCQRNYSKSLKIIGDEGTIIWDFIGDKVILLKPANKKKIWKVPDGFKKNDMYINEMKHWLSVIKGERLPETTLSQGIRVTKIAVAAKEASRQEKHIYLN